MVNKIDPCKAYSMISASENGNPAIDIAAAKDNECIYLEQDSI
jgi:hypothetical protein